jgi:hypothetical protein
MMVIGFALAAWGKPLGEIPEAGDLPRGRSREAILQRFQSHFHVG